MATSVVESTPIATVASLIAKQTSLHDVPGSDLAQLIQVALAHGVGPMLLWTAHQQAYDTSDRAWTALIDANWEATAHFMLITSMQREVTTALTTAGIPCIWLKGADLARTVYPQPSLRPMVDVDVLVPYDDRQRALGIVQAHGYQLEDHDLFQNAHDLVHHYHLKRSLQPAARLELHYRLLGYSDRLLPLSQLEWFWGQTRTWSNGRDQFTTLRPEAHLLYLCAHAILLHGEADFRLLRYFDLHRLITQTDPFDWQIVIDQSVALGWTYAVERALLVSQHLFATPIADNVLAELRQRRPPHETVAVVEERAVRGSRWQAMQAQFAAMSLPARIRLAWRIAIPPTTYMRWRYNVDTPWKLPAAYVCRWLDAAREVGRWCSSGKS